MQSFKFAANYLIMRFLMLSMMACSVLFSSCKDNAQNETTETPLGPPQSKLSAPGTTQLISVVNNYYKLKDALIAGKAVQADSATIELVAATDGLSRYLMIDSLNKIELQPYLDTIKSASGQIVATNDETTEKKRIPFERISDATFNLLKTAEIKNAKIYRQYCPMAFNDKGAYWLSNETEIRNPYFGKKMLECGEVTDSL